MVPEAEIRRTSQVTFPLLSPCLSLSNSCCLLASRQTDAKTTIAAKATSGRLTSFLQITRIRRGFGFIRKKEFVMWRALTLREVTSRADAALLVGFLTCKLG